MRNPFRPRSEEPPAAEPAGDGRAVFLDGLNDEEAEQEERDAATGWKSWRRKVARLIEGE
jgi:hypothetical protein